MFPYFQHICVPVQVIDTGHLVTSGGNPQSLILRVLAIYVVGVVQVCAPNRCSIVNDVPAKALTILFLLDTISAT